MMMYCVVNKIPLNVHMGESTSIELMYQQNSAEKKKRLCKTGTQKTKYFGTYFTIHLSNL